MKKLLLAGALALGLSACADAPTAERALRQQGFTAIEITGWSAFSCGRDDTYSTGFKAKNPYGQKVEGVVCSAWLKGATIRFF